MSVRLVNLAARFRGLRFDVPPWNMRRTNQARRWRAHAMVRNLCRYFGFSEVEFYREVHRTFGEHRLAVLMANETNPLGRVKAMRSDSFEYRLQDVCEALLERMQESNADADAYREAVDSICDRWSLKPWRVWIGTPWDDARQRSAKDPECDAGEICVIVDEGLFRDVD